jgi:integrase
LKDQARTWTERVRREILSCRADGRAFDPTEFRIVRRVLRPGDSILPEKPTGPTQEEIDADPAPRPDWTLRQALEHYDDTVTETLRGWRQVRARIQAWQREPLAARRLSDLTADDLTVWVANRRKTKKVHDAAGKLLQVEELPVAAATVRNDIYRISALYEHARAPVTKGGWGLDLANPVAAVALPELPGGRQRRLDHGHDEQQGEEDRMLAALAAGPDGPEMVALVTLALETGMRRSELLDLRAGEVRSTRLGRVIEREKSKNGHARRVVLTDRATAAVDALRVGKQKGDKLFRLGADAAAWRWDKARVAAGCPDLRLHDLRHEALSRMADAGLSPGALAAQSGHRTMQTLLRYVNASERDIRAKLAKRDA